MKNNFIRFNLGSMRSKGLRINIYLLLWVFIIIGMVYLLVRFSAISFARENGQEKSSLREEFLFYCSNKIIESGSPLVRYTEGVKPEKGIAGSLFMNQFAVEEFLTSKSQLTAKAKENAPETNGTSSIPYYHIEKTEASGEVMNTEEIQEQTEGTTLPNLNDNTTIDNTTIDNAEQDRYRIPVDSHLKYDHISSKLVSMEYMLTNGAFYNDKQAAYYVSNSVNKDENNLLEIGSLYGNIKIQETEDSSSDDSSAIEASNPGNVIEYTMEQLKDVSFLVRNFYIVDPATKATENLFNAQELLGKDMKLKQTNAAPQILIYHTHSQETYIDSRENEKSDTIVGVGSYLTQILEDRYGYKVIHDTSCYDIIDGILNRNKAYNKAEEGISRILKENPSIEVVIDLHRDGSPEKRTTIVNGEETAQIMMFNGLSCDQKGPITYLENPYLQDNLAMSLQMQLKAIDLYPGLFYKNYLNCYRYNMHLRPKSILMELGTDKNTLQSAKNAMEPFAKVLNAVLKGE